MQTRATLEQWAKGPLATLAARAGVQVPLLTNISDLPPISARINHNRWIADCPACGGAEFVWPELLMMCAGCWNGSDGHQWRRVTLPEDRTQIEAVLRARPLPANRNWQSGETVEKLMAENEQQGLPTNG